MPFQRSQYKCNAQALSASEPPRHLEHSRKCLQDCFLRGCLQAYISLVLTCFPPPLKLISIHGRSRLLRRSRLPVCLWGLLLRGDVLGPGNGFLLCFGGDWRLCWS